jgi:hypothetical protein
MPGEVITTSLWSDWSAEASTTVLHVCKALWAVSVLSSRESRALMRAASDCIAARCCS